MGLLFRIIVGVALQFLGYLFAPKPKGPKPAATSDLKSPTAEAGRPITVVAGSITVTGPNIIGYCNKQSRHRKMRKSGKK